MDEIIGFWAFTNPLRTGGVLGHVSVFWLRWCGVV